MNEGYRWERLQLELSVVFLVAVLVNKLRLDFACSVYHRCRQRWTGAPRSAQVGHVDYYRARNGSYRYWQMAEMGQSDADWVVGRVSGV